MSPLYPGIAGINLVVVCPTLLGCTADLIPHGGAIRASIASTEQLLVDVLFRLHAGADHIERVCEIGTNEFADLENHRIQNHREWWSGRTTVAINQIGVAIDRPLRPRRDHW